MEELTLDTDHTVPELMIGTVRHPTVPIDTIQGPTVQGHPTVHLTGQIHAGDQAQMN